MSFLSEKQVVIKEKVNKFINISFISKVMYPNQLTNIVFIKKDNGKQSVYINFTNLNKAIQIIGHELLSFLNVYLGYHKILMANEDRGKTYFITDQGTQCYNVMPFGLKNTKVTFQWLINNVFSKQIGKNIVAYMDDITLKSTKA